jgi:hemoglobin
MEEILLKILLLTFLLLNACATQTNANQSLYERIGGKDMLSKISSDTIDIVASDPRTKRSFKDVKLKTLKESITNFLCVKTGGNCEYEGETMKNSHAEAGITTAEFELMVQVMRDVMDKNHVGIREKNELLKILAPMKRDVVTK